MPGNRITCWQAPVRQRVPGQRQVPVQQRRRQVLRQVRQRGPQQELQQRGQRPGRAREPEQPPSCRRRPGRKRRSGMPAGWNASCVSSKRWFRQIADLATHLSHGQPRKPGHRIRLPNRANCQAQDQSSVTAPRGSVTDIRVNTDESATNPDRPTLRQLRAPLGSAGPLPSHPVAAGRPGDARAWHPSHRRERPPH